MNLKLCTENLVKLRNVDPMITSYNIEMTEVTGGTFWKPYTPEQVAGTEEYAIADVTNTSAMMQYYGPLNMYDERLRKMAKGIPSVWVRVSGSWATKTYYDFSDSEEVVRPEGYENVLTKKQWIGVLDYVKAMDGKLLISLANCEGNHHKDEPWNPEQTKMLLDFSKEYGVPVLAIEFVNEPNYIDITGYPKGYTVEDYGKDFDFFAKWLRENYPEILIVGPSSATNEQGIHPRLDAPRRFFKAILTRDMLAACQEKPDIFSYHYYNGMSERAAATGGHFPVDEALTEDYLSVAERAVKYYVEMSKDVITNGQLWVTESGDAACGGNTWGSTFLDVIRSANELGIFTKYTEGVIFHNTFCSSDYGWLDHHTLLPRPNYWLNYIWNQLVGTSTYDAEWENCEGAHVYAYSRKDEKDGYVYMIINNSKTEETVVDFDKAVEVYLLSADEIRGKEIKLNGTVLELAENDAFPEMISEGCENGKVVLPPVSVVFVVV